MAGENKLSLFVLTHDMALGRRITDLLAGTTFVVRVTTPEAIDFSPGDMSVLIVDCATISTDTIFNLSHDTPHPIIALVAAGEGENTLHVGAWDYLERDALTPQLLRRALRYVINQQRLERQLDRTIRELRTSEMRFESMMAADFDGVIVVDNEGTIHFVNPAAEALFERTAEELVGGHLGLPLSGDELTELEILQTPSDIAIAQMRVHETEWKGASAYVLSLRDITELKEVERNLDQTARLNHQFAAAITNMNVGVIITDPAQPDNPVIFVNAGFTRITGYDADQVIGRNCRFLQGPETNVVDVQDMRRAVHNIRSYTGTVLNYRQDGTPFWNEIKIRPIFDSQGQLINFVGLMHDVTTRKEAEKAQLEQERLRIALEKERELSQVKTLFMSTISHEFRTPLAIIMSASEMLERYLDYLAPPERLERLNNIKNQVFHLEEMLNEISIVIRAQLGNLEYQPETMNLRLFSQAIIDEFRLLDRQQHHFTFFATPGDYEIAADHKLLRHILTNLLSNATKYSAGGSEVRVELERSEEDVIVRVIDHGIGIPQADQKRLFEPFFRASNTHNIDGTGLGLKVVLDCVAIHGGTIRVDSLLGTGTTCTIRLPVSPIT